eukprot:11294636-Alexandrium_andersonii.AAC.1
MRRASSRALSTFRPHMVGSHAWWSGLAWVTGPYCRCGVATSSRTFDIDWAMAMVVLRELVRMEIMYSSLR